MKTSNAVTAAAVLGTAYVAAQLVADVSAVKIITTPFGAVPGGTYIFALTFTLRDLIHRRLGKSVALWFVALAALANLFLVGYTTFVSHATPAPFDTANVAFAAVFAVVPIITLASIIAELVSETADTLVYERIYRRSHIAGMLVSNLFGTILDSAIFIAIAFGASGMPVSALASMVGSTAAFKFVVAGVLALAAWGLSNHVAQE